MSLLSNIPVGVKVGAAALGLGAAALVLQSFVHKGELKDLEEERQELIKQLEEDKTQELEELRQEKDSIYSELQVQVSELEDQSKRLRRKLYHYETRPNIDIDFIDAARIITGATYRPGDGDSNNN